MTSEVLKNILDDLDDEELSTFQWFLQQPNNVQGLPAIKKSRLQTTNRCSTVDVMVQTYQPQRAVQVTRVVLEKISRKDLLQSLPASSSGPEVHVSDVGETSENREPSSSQTQPPLPQTEAVTVLVPEPRPIRYYQQKLQSNFQDKFPCAPEGWAEDEQRLVDMETLRVTPAGVPWLTPGLRKYSCQLTVDTNTVNRKLKLSDNNRKVTHVEEDQSYPDHPDRFDWYHQLLCRTGLTGRCYWEVEWRRGVEISVSYRGIGRKGRRADCRFGWNDQSWSLFCSDDGYSVIHNDSKTSIRSSSVSHRVSVYVDVPAGTLSFYRVSSDSLIHLHTFNTTFTQPLYPGFGFSWWPGSSVFLVEKQC